MKGWKGYTCSVFCHAAVTVVVMVAIWYGATHVIAWAVAPPYGTPWLMGVVLLSAWLLVLLVGTYLMNASRPLSSSLAGKAVLGIGILLVLAALLVLAGLTKRVWV